MSERLLVVLTREMETLERVFKELKPIKGAEPSEEAGSVAGVVAAGSKGRIEAIGQMTRTLEKLLELKRPEALAERGDEDAADGEASRLRDELLRRLRALDKRRRGGATLFSAEGDFVGEVRRAGADEGAAEIAGVVAGVAAGAVSSATSDGAAGAGAQEPAS